MNLLNDNEQPSGKRRYSMNIEKEKKPEDKGFLTEMKRKSGNFLGKIKGNKDVENNIYFLEGVTHLLKKSRDSENLVNILIMRKLE